MRTTDKPVRMVDCGRIKYLNYRGTKVRCLGRVALYPSVASNFLQGVCDTCGISTGEMNDKQRT